MNIVLQRDLQLSRFKPCPQFRRYNRTNVILSPKHAIANPRYEIVNKVPQSRRNHAHHRSQHSPNPTKPPPNMQKCSRPYQKRPISSQHHNAVRQSHPPLHRHARRKSLALQRRKPKRARAVIVLQHKFHRAMAQPTMSIVKKIFRALRFLPHQKSIARARRNTVSRAANRTYGNDFPFPLATLSETL